MVIICDEEERKKTIHFGGVKKNGTPYYDYTTGGNRDAYLSRHSVNETYTKSAMNTPAFWSRWILWEKKTVASAIRNLRKKFNMKITDCM